jgi:hypothetical protein
MAIKRLPAGGDADLSDSPPLAPSDGDLWYETDTGRTLIYYADGTSSQWVEVGASASVTNNAITTSDAAPSSPSVGDIWFESDTGDLFTYYDGVWVEVGQATDTANLGLSDADGDTLIQVEESADEDTIRFDTAGTERMVIKSDGKVGIGTASPLEQVEIAGVNDRTALRLSGAGGSSLVTGKVYLGMHQWASGANPSVRIGAEEISASNYDANLVFQTRDSGSDVLPTTRMTIDHEGNVGIGTGSPLAPLDVRSTAAYESSGVGNASAYFKGGGDYGVSLTLDSDGTSDDVARTRYLNAGTNKWQVNVGDDIQWNSATWTQRMLLSAAGDLTVGGRVTTTSQPSFNAYVSGGAWTISATNGVVAFNSIRHNVGSHFSTSTYRFTAPVAGNYFFSYHFFMYTSYDNDTNTYYGFHKNGVSHLTTNHGVEGQDGGQAMSAVISLAANDYVTVQKVGGGTISSYGGQYNSFTGHLLG